jgi:hypothetical protein
MPKRERDNASTHGKVLSGPTTNISQKIDSSDQRLISGGKHQRLDSETTSMPGCKRSDLLLSTNYSKRPVAGSQHVISLDNLDFEKNTHTEIELNRERYHVYVPMDLAQFQCDVYDARDHTELALALAQICILEYNDGNQGVSVKSPDYRCCVSTGEFKKPDANGIVLRRNVIVIDRTNVLGGNDEEKTRAIKQLFEQVPNNEHMNFMCTGGNGDFSDVIKLCKQTPQCTIHNQTMEAPIVSYAGVAMTDAFYNACNGDTFVTSNLYSLMTTQNGPVPSCHGDPLHWIWNAEQHYYNKHGCRQPRKLWYLKANTDADVDYYNGFDRLDFQKNNPRDSAAESRIGRKFHFIPFKMGYDNETENDEAPRYGLLDSMNQRRVGVAQSNAGAYASIDITNCGKCIN